MPEKTRRCDSCCVYFKAAKTSIVPLRKIELQFKGSAVFWYMENSVLQKFELVVTMLTGSEKCEDSEKKHGMSTVRIALQPCKRPI